MKLLDLPTFIDVYVKYDIFFNFNLLTGQYKDEFITIFNGKEKE